MAGIRLQPQAGRSRQNTGVVPPGYGAGRSIRLPNVSYAPPRPRPEAAPAGMPVRTGTQLTDLRPRQIPQMPSTPMMPFPAPAAPAAPAPVAPSLNALSIMAPEEEPMSGAGAIEKGMGGLRASLGQRIHPSLDRLLRARAY